MDAVIRAGRYGFAYGLCGDDRMLFWNIANRLEMIYQHRGRNMALPD
jgi:hypothetical protein